MRTTLKFIISITALISAVSTAVLFLSYFDSIVELFGNAIRKISAKVNANTLKNKND